VAQPPDWLRRTDLEKTQGLAPSAGLGSRIERLDRAYDSEIAASADLNLRGAALAAGSSIAILLLALFSATWLDDNTWLLPDLWDAVMQVALPVTVFALAACVLMAGLAVWPTWGSAQERRDRLAYLNEGDDDKAAAALLTLADGQRAANERKARLLRLASIPLLVAVVGALAQSMVFALKAEPADGNRADGPGPRDEEVKGLPPADEQQQLALRYAPRVWLHGDERFGPLDPAEFVRSSALEWHRRRDDATVAKRRSVAAERLGAACDDASGGCYEHGGYIARELTRPFNGHPARPESLHPRRGFALDVDNDARRGVGGDDPGVPVFYEFRRTSDELLVTYWLFYAYSRPHVLDGGGAAEPLLKQLSHEGDWENIDVALTPDGTTPLAVYFYGHGTPMRMPWDEVCKLGRRLEDCTSGRAGHPVVYSALDSHASYGAPGTTEVCGPLGCADDLRERGTRWDTWSGERSVRPARLQPWFGFGGAWGAAGSVGDQTGPLGPSPWKLPANPDPGDLATVHG
jgi:hypothetical protein